MKYAIALLGLLLLTGCTQTSNTTQASNQTVLAGSVVEVDVIAKNWEFNPSTIRVKQGDTVQLHIESQDVKHGFRLPEFGVDEVLELGVDVHVAFVADKKGTFPFSCSIPCGEGHGKMTGELIVE